MVLRYTSTSLGSLFRRAAAAVRPAASSRPSTVATRLRVALQRTLTTTPHHKATTSPAYLPGRAAGPGHRSVGSAPRTRAWSPYGSPSFRPRIQAGAGTHTVGLGSARTFASGPAFASGGGASNAPVVLRAFSQLFDYDERDDLPRATAYRAYVPAPKARVTRTRARAHKIRGQRRCSTVSAASKASKTSEASLLAQLGHYFPFPVDADCVPLPPVPEDLVTPGMTATLALPLAPSLHALLSPTASVTYADAEVGIGILARLTHGLLPLHDAYAAGAARVVSLLARLEALGVLDPRSWPRTRLELTTNARGEPDILRIVFDDRSRHDVAALLAHIDEGGWWALSDARAPRLNSAEQLAITERWDEPASQLVMPTLDMSVHPAPVYEGDDEWPSSRSSTFSSPASTPDYSTPAFSNPASGLATPHSDFDYGSRHGDDYGYASDTSMSSLPSRLSEWSGSASAASLIDSLASLSSDDDRWSVSPSDADDDVGAWAAVDVDARANEVEDVVVSWIGPLGLSQPW